MKRKPFIGFSMAILLLVFGCVFGLRSHIGNPKRTLPWVTVVGVAPDVRLDAPDKPAGEQWYFPLEQPAIIEGSGAPGM